MNIVGLGQRVRIYTGEAAQWQWKPLFLAVLEFLRAEGAAGATVTRGVAGFGANSRIHTATSTGLTRPSGWSGCCPRSAPWLPRAW